MAINISSLNATEIAFIKRDGALRDNNVSKLQKGDLKDKLNEALSSGNQLNIKTLQKATDFNESIHLKMSKIETKSLFFITVLMISLIKRLRFF